MFLLRLLFLRLCLPKCLHVRCFKTKQGVKLATIFFHPEKLGKVATTFRTFSERCVQCIQNPKQRWWKCAAKTSLFLLKRLDSRKLRFAKCLDGFQFTHFHFIRKGAPTTCGPPIK